MSNLSNLSNPSQEQLAFQQFMRQLIQPFDKDHYVIGEENYVRFLSKKPNDQAIEQVKGPVDVSGEYYLVNTNKEVYDEYLSVNINKEVYDEQLPLQLQQFMKWLMHPYGNSYVVGKEKYDNLLAERPSIVEHVEGPVTFNGKFYIIGKEVYDQSLIIEQQNHHLSLQFMRQLVQQINNDYYVIGKEIYENYKHFLEQAAARPININEEYFVISKEVFDNYRLVNQPDYARIAFQSQIQTLEKNNNDLQLQIQTLEKNNNDLQSQIQTLNKNQEELNSELLKPRDDLHEISDLKSQYQILEKKHNDLLNDRNKLQIEASRYQSALGDATSFHLGNQDSNSASQLSKDISNLHQKLERFCGTKRGVKVDEQKARELLGKYNCSTTGKLNDNLVSGVLERNVIETIIEKTNEYFDREKNGKDKKDKEQVDEEQQHNLETNIVDTTKQLLEMTEVFSTIRTGTDEVSKAIPTKLRQQIYSVLGHRGFSKTVMDENEKVHPLILNLRKDVLDLMDSCREITDGKKSAESEKNIIEIIRQVVNIFFFRLKVQEPIAEWKWFENNDEINTLTMGGYYNENEIENLCVDVCMFPLIGSNISSSDGDEKVMFQAQILTKKKNI